MRVFIHEKKKKKKRYGSLLADAQRPISQRVTDTLSVGDPNPPLIIKRDFLLASRRGEPANPVPVVAVPDGVRKRYRDDNNAP